MSIDFDALLPSLVALCRKYGVAELAVFGSVARGDDTPDSDVDFLYVPTTDNELGWEFYRLGDELAALLGREVDIVPKEHLHWVMREGVLADAKVLYAA